VARAGGKLNARQSSACVMDFVRPIGRSRRVSSCGAVLRQPNGVGRCAEAHAIVRAKLGCVGHGSSCGMSGAACARAQCAGRAMTGDRPQRCISIWSGVSSGRPCLPDTGQSPSSCPAAFRGHRKHEYLQGTPGARSRGETSGSRSAPRGPAQSSAARTDDPGAPQQRQAAAPKVLPPWYAGFVASRETAHAINGDRL
jgi:hypothetical protein